MRSAAELTDLKQRLKQLIAEEDIGHALRATLASVPSHASVANTLCLLQARLHDLRRSELRGVIGPEELQRGYARIRADLLTFIDELTLADFEPAIPAKRLPADRSGHLLYAIPHAMPLERETRCVVRLAFEEETLRRDLEATDAVTTRPIRIAEVMDVALIDPNEADTFQVRSISSPEQFVERGDYSEWIFLVKPLRTGTYPLLLRIAVIELRQGKERRKEIVLEEEIQILAEAPEAGEAAPAFKEAGLLSTKPEDPSDADGPVDEFMPPPSPRIVAPRPPAAARPAPKPPEPGRGAPVPGAERAKPSRRRWLAIAASLALVVTAGVWILTSDRSDPSTISAPAEETRKQQRPELVEPGRERLRPDTLRPDSLSRSN